MNSGAFGQLLVLGAIWGAAFMFLRIAAPEFGAIALAGVRVVIACALMIVIVLVMREPTHFKTHWKKYLFVGGVNTAVPFIAYCFAALYIPSGYSAIANSTTPIWGALITAIWFREKLGALKWLGIAFAFAGVVALVGLQPVAITPMVVASMFVVLFAAAMYATASFLIRRYLQDIPGLVGATGMVWGATVWLIVPALFTAPRTMPSTNAWVSVVALAVLCTAIGYILFFRLIAKYGPQRASSVAFLFPAFAAFWGWLFLDEPITANMLIGMALVLAGTALVSRNSTGVSGLHWQRLRDWIFWPLVFTFSPLVLRKRIAARYQAGEHYFEHEVLALRANMHRLLPDADVVAAAKQHRLLRFIDRCDVFMSVFRERHTLQTAIEVTSELPSVNRAAMVLSAHRGNGWWTLSILASQGKPVELVSAPFPQLRGMGERLWAPYLRLRWHEMNRMGGLPLITMRGASKHVRNALTNGGRVIATIDIPPALAKRCSPVSFFGRTAYMPRQAIDIAIETGTELWLFFGDVDPETLKQHIRFERIDTSQGAPAAFADYVSRIEQAIRAQPGTWHAWGDIDLYFAQPTTPAPNAAQSS
jgi:drug/metabolite transporter (DMT)-like permease/lauroyl/myristoyl acyltransferase